MRSGSGKGMAEGYAICVYVKGRPAAIMIELSNARARAIVAMIESTEDASGPNRAELERVFRSRQAPDFDDPDARWAIAYVVAWYWGERLRRSRGDGAFLASEGASAWSIPEASIDFIEVIDLEATTTPPPKDYRRQLAGFRLVSGADNAPGSE